MIKFTTRFIKIESTIYLVMTELNRNKYSQDVHFVNKDEREFIIVGTAHISRQSADLVKEVIEKEKPDVVCVELDEKRLKALSEKNRWENLDLRQVIKNKQLSTLIINLVLSSYQKKLGEKLGVMPGTELLEAVQTANENNIPVKAIEIIIFLIQLLILLLIIKIIAVIPDKKTNANSKLIVLILFTPELL